MEPRPPHLLKRMAPRRPPAWEAIEAVGRRPQAVEVEGEATKLDRLLTPVREDRRAVEAGAVGVEAVAIDHLEGAYADRQLEGVGPRLRPLDQLAPVPELLRPPDQF